MLGNAPGPQLVMPEAASNYIGADMTFHMILTNHQWFQLLCKLFFTRWMWNLHTSECWNTYIKFKLAILIMRPLEHPLSSEKCIFHYDKAGRTVKALQYIHWSGFNNTEENFSLRDNHLEHRETKQNFIFEDSERISEENKENCEKPWPAGHILFIKTAERSTFESFIQTRNLSGFKEALTDLELGEHLTDSEGTHT